MQEASLNPTTYSTYCSKWEKFLVFARNSTNVHVDAPVSSHLVALYVAKLNLEGARTSTIRGYLSAIAHMHIKRDLPDPTDSPSIKMALQGAQILEPSICDNELQPINKQLLHKMLDSIPFITKVTYDQLLLKALFLTTYYACLRAGEIVESDKADHTISISQIELHDDSYGIRFDSYKHSQSRNTSNERGSIPLYIVNAIPMSKFCPVKALKSFLKIRMQIEGPIFIDRAGSNIKRDYLSKNLKISLELCQIPPARYNTHSFRIGRATQLADEGYSDEIIRTTGRWKSNAFKKYIRRSAFIMPS